MRRAAPSYNDDGGYDLIDLPGGVQTRVFTRQDLRLNRDGSLKPPQVSLLHIGSGRLAALACPRARTDPSSARRKYRLSLCLTRGRLD